MSDFIKIAPMEIEKESFRIITDELYDKGIVLDEKQAPIIKRVIHTTADFSFADTLKFTQKAIETGCELIRSGATIITDTNMTLAGINKRVEKYGCCVKCFMADEEVARIAKEQGVTRASVSMEKAMALTGPKIFAIGNAPTALIELNRIYEETGNKPDLLIGVPVGFVNVEYSKELFIGKDIEYIINLGRKGGSNIAAAIVNALSLLVE